MGWRIQHLFTLVHSQQDSVLTQLYDCTSQSAALTATDHHSHARYKRCRRMHTTYQAVRVQKENDIIPVPIWGLCHDIFHCPGDEVILEFHHPAPHPPNSGFVVRIASVMQVGTLLLLILLAMQPVLLRKTSSSIFLRASSWL